MSEDQAEYSGGEAAPTESAREAFEAQRAAKLNADNDARERDSRMGLPSRRLALDYAMGRVCFGAPRDTETVIAEARRGDAERGMNDPRRANRSLTPARWPAEASLERRIFQA